MKGSQTFQRPAYISESIKDMKCFRYIPLTYVYYMLGKIIETNLDFLFANSKQYLNSHSSTFLRPLWRRHMKASNYSHGICKHTPEASHFKPLICYVIRIIKYSFNFLVNNTFRYKLSAQRILSTVVESCHHLLNS